MADNNLQAIIEWLKNAQRTQQVQGIGKSLEEALKSLAESRAKDAGLWSQAFQDPTKPLKVTDKAAFNEMNQRTLAGPMGFAPVGIFIGAGAKTWNEAMNKAAKELEAAGVSARNIWEKTGNWKAPDGKWRQEIADNTAEFRANFDASAASKANDYKGGLESAIGGMYRHDPLYQAYPDLLTTDRMTVKKLPDWLPDSANSGEYKRTIGGKGYLELRNKTEQGALDTAAHELQHGVQYREGFPQGAMESQFRDIPNGLTAFEQYQRQMGEAEARAAAARRMLTPEQRRQLFPEDSYDMPISSLLYRDPFGKTIK
jgi:hypothetical protein